jgi:hypothetical protein
MAMVGVLGQNDRGALGGEESAGSAASMSS